MSRIRFEKDWKYAIGGNKVVVFPAGVHQVSAAIEKNAVDEAKAAVTVASDDKEQVLPALEVDLAGNPLTPEDLKHLGGKAKK